MVLKKEQISYFSYLIALLNICAFLVLRIGDKLTNGAFFYILIIHILLIISIYKNKFLEYAFILYFSLICEIVMQLFIEYKYGLVFTYQRIIDIILYLFVFCVLTFTFKKKTNGLFAANLLFLLMGITNFLVTYYRGKPVYFPDLFIIKTLNNVLKWGGYGIPFSILLIICIGIMILNCVLCLVKCPPMKTEENVHRIVYPVCASMFLFLITVCRIPTLLNFRSYYFSTTEYWLYSFSMSAYSMNIRKPVSYDPKIIPVEETSDSKNAIPSKLPNILFIMNESFTDYRYIGDFENSYMVMPFYDSLIKSSNCINGELAVSIYGGNTANTEFEVLTGVSTFLLPKDTTAFNLYMNSSVYSIVDYFEDIGYETVAFHPSAATNYNRDNAYTNLGFNQIYFQEDYNDLETLRDYTVSDMSDYKHVIELFDNKPKEQKYFLFNVTVQNHGPFDKYSNDFEYRFRFSKAGMENTEQYLSCLNYSDEALEYLITYLKDYDEDVLLVFFGDHQPKVDESFYEMLFSKPSEQWLGTEERLKYCVPYFVWSNFDSNFTISEKIISANYLGVEIIELLGLPETGYYKYLNNLRKEYPVISISGISSDGETYTTDKKCINNYEKICFNLLLDHKKEWKDFFRLRE